MGVVEICNKKKLLADALQNWLNHQALAKSQASVTNEHRNEVLSFFFNEVHSELSNQDVLWVADKLKSSGIMKKFLELTFTNRIQSIESLVFLYQGSKSAPVLSVIENLIIQAIETNVNYFNSFDQFNDALLIRLAKKSGKSRMLICQRLTSTIASDKVVEMMVKRGGNESISNWINTSNSVSGKEALFQKQANKGYKNPFYAAYDIRAKTYPKEQNRLVTTDKEQMSGISSVLRELRLGIKS
jgi:hypothetical protein